MLRFAALLLRGVIATFTGLLIAGGTLTLAADRAAVQRPSLVAPIQHTLRVPSVQGQAFVVAKGFLQDSGFAWHVSGAVKGYAANTVAEQHPAPGTVVVDTGTPRITLTLKRNRAYAQRGIPQNDAPYAGTAIRPAPASGSPQAAAVPTGT